MVLCHSTGPRWCSLRALRWHCSCAGNGIGDEGMKAFSEALESNSSLTSVDLGGMPVRHHMNVRCMRLRLCCAALGPDSCCCRGPLVQTKRFDQVPCTAREGPRRFC